MHKNNFDFLRLIFAVFVLVTHSWPISALRESDFLDLWTDHQICFSYLGVRGFFIISGYLIYQSLQRSKGLVDYFWKRTLRLWPALLVFSALVVILGPLVYDAAVGGPYLQNRDVWTYLPRNATLYAFQANIKGIFTDNPYPMMINGSLWTICIEFTCYVGLAAFILVRKWPTVSKTMLCLIWVGLLVSYHLWYDYLYTQYFFFNKGQLLELSTFFVGGAILAAFEFEKMKHLSWIAVGAAVVMTVAVLLGWFLTGIHFAFLPLLVIALGVQSTPYLRDLGSKVGDMSYGIYIYGFPVQQALMYFFGMDCLTLMLTSLPITVVLGYLSWHLVEKRALVLKKYSLRWS